MNDNQNREIKAGQAVYTRLILSVYDIWVLVISNRWIWRCPTRKILNLYNQNISTRHLDVGVGTGFYLDKCRFPGKVERLDLLDLNPNCLEKTSTRIQRYQPVSNQANILGPLNLEPAIYDSIAINYLLHCLPGSLREKSVVFDHLDPCLASGGCIFGTTLLSVGVPRSSLARRLMDFYNSKGIFSNQSDSLSDLKQQLAARYTRFEIQTIGAVAFFTVWKK